VEENRWGLRRGLSAEERRKGGGRVWSAESNIGAPVGIEERQSQGKECGNGVLSAESNRGALIKTEGIMECPSLRRSTERGGIDYGRR